MARGGHDHHDQLAMQWRTYGWSHSLQGIVLKPQKKLGCQDPGGCEKTFFVSVSSFEVYREVVIEKSVMNFWCNLQLLDHDPTWRLLFELCQTGSCTKSSPATYPKPDIS